MGERNLTERDEQSTIWDYYKPRHTHSWKMLVLSWRDLDQVNIHEIEYRWENFIIRLWLYRTTIKTLTALRVVKPEALRVLCNFDSQFDINGQNGLKAIRDMIEHFDDYAAGTGRGPGERDRDLDPWRAVSKEQFRRGAFMLDRSKSYEAAIKLRFDAKQVSDKFIVWYKSTN